ncbi:uncharacterized protein LOC135829926 isoform X2 [Sycon ciliatum]|uniref:uncharacterized protein LOC135829926 isoform X2 n=1 Tax=Sycon ciliatum TaxID=27933 RepID=UPI0031F6818A
MLVPELSSRPIGCPRTRIARLYSRQVLPGTDVCQVGHFHQQELPTPPVIGDTVDSDWDIVVLIQKMDDNPFRNDTFVSSVQVWMNDLDPDRFRTVAQRKGLLDSDSVRTLTRIYKNEGQLQHNQKLINMLVAGEMDTYLKLCDAVKAMGFTPRYDEMISIVKDRLEETRRPGDDLDPRNVYIDRHKISAASTSRINYVQAGTGVADNIEALRNTAQVISNQGLLTPPSSDDNEEFGIEEASQEALSETDVTVYVAEDFDKSMKQGSNDEGAKEIIRTTLEDIGYIDEKIFFDKFRPSKGIVYSVSAEKVLIRIVIDTVDSEFIRNAIINRLKRLTQSRGRVVVIFSGDYTSIEVFLLVPGRCAIALHYTAVVFPGILSGLGILEWNLVGSLDFFDLRVSSDVPWLDNTGIQPVRRLFSELLSRGLTDTELPNLDLAQPKLKSLVEKHEHDNEFIDFLGKFILNELRTNQFLPDSDTKISSPGKSSKPPVAPKPTPPAKPQVASHSSLSLSEKLLRSIRAGDLRAVKKVIGEGADVNCTDEYGDSALHNAASQSRPKCVHALLQQRATHNARNSFQDIPLHLAARWTRKRMRISCWKPDVMSMRSTSMVIAHCMWQRSGTAKGWPTSCSQPAQIVQSRTRLASDPSTSAIPDRLFADCWPTT